MRCMQFVLFGDSSPVLSVTDETLVFADANKLSYNPLESCPLTLPMPPRLTEDLQLPTPPPRQHAALCWLVGDAVVGVEHLETGAVLFEKPEQRGKEEAAGSHVEAP